MKTLNCKTLPVVVFSILFLLGTAEAAFSQSSDPTPDSSVTFHVTSNSTSATGSEVRVDSITRSRIEDTAIGAITEKEVLAASHIDWGTCPFQTALEEFTAYSGYAYEKHSEHIEPTVPRSLTVYTLTIDLTRNDAATSQVTIQHENRAGNVSVHQISSWIDGIYDFTLGTTDQRLAKRQYNDCRNGLLSYYGQI